MFQISGCPLHWSSWHFVLTKASKKISDLLVRLIRSRRVPAASLRNKQMISWGGEPAVFLCVSPYLNFTVSVHTDHDFFCHHSGLDSHIESRRQVCGLHSICSCVMCVDSSLCNCCHVTVRRVEGLHSWWIICFLTDVFSNKRTGFSLEASFSSLTEN